MTEPNAYFRQHYAVDAPQIDGTAFRPWWKVRPKETPKLEILFYVDHAISITEYRAGQRFRALAEIVMAGDFPSPPWFDKTGKSRGGLDLAISRRRDARSRLERVRVDMGPVGFALLEYHLVKDLSWTDLGARFLHHPKTVRVWTIAALRRLADVMWA